MTTVREFYLERRRAEMPIFLSVLNALPADRLEYKPHDRSPSAQQLLCTLTGELVSCVDAASHYRAQWGDETARPLGEMVALFERRATELSDVVSKMDDAGWNRAADFYYNGRKVNEMPVGQFLWYIHFDAIHHRGQLAAYLRPMGGKVPAIYGPSADTR